MRGERSRDAIRVVVHHKREGGKRQVGGKGSRVGNF